MQELICTCRRSKRERWKAVRFSHLAKLSCWLAVGACTLHQTDHLALKGEISMKQTLQSNVGHDVGRKLGQPKTLLHGPGSPSAFIPLLKADI
jgi:hypothetical protein